MCEAIKSWDSKNLLLNYLGLNSPYVLLGCGSEAPRGYYSCSVTCNDSTLRIGVIVNQLQPPAILYLATTQRIVLGYDQSVATLDCRTASLLKNVVLDGVFFEFVMNEEYQQILGMHELGVVAFSMCGEQLWSYTTKDILEGWSITDRHLSITVMDATSPILLTLADGALLKPEGR